jgi:ABC-type uncharacterized transport system involved in gliding motility auxiliary subunit
MKQILEFEGYELAEFSYPASSGGPPAGDPDLIILPGPHKLLPERFLETLDAFMTEGGALLLLLDPQAEMADTSLAAGLEELLARHGLSVSEGFIVDMGEENIQLGKGFEVPVVSRYAQHPLTRAYQRSPELTAFPLARSLRALDGGSARPLALSSQESFEERGPFDGHVHFDQAVDVGGPFVLAAAADSSGEGGGPLVVIGDSHFVTGEHIDWEGNANFLLRSVAWLCGQGRRLDPAHPRHEAALLRLDRADRRLYLAFNLFVLPLLVLILWPLRLLWRRRRRSGGHT